MMVSGLDGDTQIGCGIMVTAMEMFGVMGTTIIGQDLIRIMEACTILLIHSGGIIILTTVMVMDMQICGGMDTIRGIIITHILKTGTHQFHWLAAEEALEMLYHPDPLQQTILVSVADLTELRLVALMID